MVRRKNILIPYEVSKEAWSILSKNISEVILAREHLILLIFNKKFWGLHFHTRKAIRLYNKLNPPDKLKQIPIFPFVLIVPFYLLILSLCISISMFVLNRLEMYNEHLLTMTGAFYAIPLIFAMSKIGNRMVRKYYNRININYRIMEKVVVK